MENDLIQFNQFGFTENVEFGLVKLFMAADWVVKTVIVLLITSSVVCWGIILQKSLHLRRLRRSASKFEQLFWSGTSIPELIKTIDHNPGNPLEAVLVACYDEWQRSDQELDKGTGQRVLERIANLARTTLDTEIIDASRHLSLLASFGSTCPFIGLFGTVWGIMNSFSAIAASKQTSLAVVAPGIAEALFATALGLVVAIPATIAYNKFVSDLDRISQNNEHFTTEVLAIFSRQVAMIG